LLNERLSWKAALRPMPRILLSSKLGDSLHQGAGEGREGELDCILSENVTTTAAWSWSREKGNAAKCFQRLLSGGSKENEGDPLCALRHRVPNWGLSEVSNVAAKKRV